MLSLVHQNPQLLFFRAAPIQSVPRQCCFMGYSISEASIYISFCWASERFREESMPLICWGSPYGRPFLHHFNYSSQCRGICRFDGYPITPAVADCFVCLFVLPLVSCLLPVSSGIYISPDTTLLVKFTCSMLSGLSFPIYLVHNYKKQHCHKPFLSYYPYLFHLNYFWYLPSDNIS